MDKLKFKLVLAGNKISPYLQTIFDSEKIPVVVAITMYLLSMIFTAPTRHGADRFYVLALNIIEHHSVNIHELIQDGNHYAQVSVDVLQHDGVNYIGVHPGQAFIGLPGLYVYRFISDVNIFSDPILTTQDANDKLDFLLGTFAMNSTSNAAITAITALFFIYLVDKAFLYERRNKFKISVFMLFFYLATPLFYYSTHIIENQAESCLIFITLGMLCLALLIEDKWKNKYYLVIGLIAGFAFLINFSSLILLPFGFVHILFSGFVNVDFTNFKNTIESIRSEIYANCKKKILSAIWMLLGWSFLAFLMLYYQYLLFSNPFTSVYVFLAELPDKFSPTIMDYIKAFSDSLLQYLFSPEVGLLSYTPLLAFPVIVAISRFKTEKIEKAVLITPDQSLRRSLFRTMLTIQPLYIFFYTLFAAMHLVENGELISNYNLYSARHLLPIVLPLGYILFDSIKSLSDLSPVKKMIFWGLLIFLWAFSMATNITAVLIGDWIFSLNQIWNYIQYLLDYGYQGLISQGRSLVDW